MNTETRAERINICFIGRTNVGKSTIINKLVNQDVSIISEIPGTTTDPVAKRYEFNNIGAVTLYDTAGYDDISELGKKRLERSLKILNKSDLAILVVDNDGLLEEDLKFIDRIMELNIKYFIIQNKTDLSPVHSVNNAIHFSDKLGNANLIVKKIITTLKQQNEKQLLAGIVSAYATIILVMPIDDAAPKGRIIIPQAQVIREILNNSAIAICCKDTEIKDVIDNLKYKPAYVISDSQVIKYVCEMVPEDIPVTTFSILFARYKGELKFLLDGLKVLKSLTENDRVLIAEGCSHHTTCDDIGTVKIPKWLKDYLGFLPNIDSCTGSDFPDDLKDYKLVIHCGACMLTRTEMIRRLQQCVKQNIPMTNYGMIISEMNGVLKRVTRL